MADPSGSGTVALLWDGYRDASLAQRSLASLRTLICPFERIIRHVPPNARILDIGCGTGAMLNLLAARGCIREGIGCEINEGAIRAAEKAARRLSAPHVQFRQAASVRHWPAGPFDVVSLIDVMHHVPRSEQQAFLTAAAARVGAGGLLIYKDMAERPLWRALANRLHDLVLARQWINYVSRDDARAWATAAGLVAVTEEAFAVGPYAHELMVFARPA